MLPRTTIESLVENTPQPFELLMVLLRTVRSGRPDAYQLDRSNYNALAKLGFEKYGALTAEDIQSLGVGFDHRRDIQYITAARKERGLCSLRSLWMARRHTGSVLSDFTIAEADTIGKKHAYNQGYFGKAGE